MIDIERYCYGMMERGFSPGCQPMENLIDWQDSDRKKTGFWSILVYSKKLSPCIEKEYSLKYLGEEF